MEQGNKYVRWLAVGIVWVFAVFVAAALVYAVVSIAIAGPLWPVPVVAAGAVVWAVAYLIAYE